MMPGRQNNNNGSASAGVRGRGNRNRRFHRHMVNGQLQLRRVQPQGGNNVSSGGHNNPNQFWQNNLGGLRRTVFNSPGSSQQRPGDPSAASGMRQVGPNRGGFFSNHPFGQLRRNFNHGINNNSVRHFRNPRETSGVLGRMAPDGTFIPINPGGLFGFPPLNAGPRPLFPPGFVPPGISNPNQKKQVLCKHYVNARGCLNRPRCKYMHEDFPCKLYHVLGQCTQGSDCKFSHEIMSNQKKHILATYVEKGVEGFPKMSRGEVFAAVNEQELRRGPAIDSIVNSESLADTSSPPASLEIENDASEIASINEEESGTNNKSSVETKSLPVSTVFIPESLDETGPTIHQIIQIMRRKIEQSRSTSENDHQLGVMQSTSHQESTSEEVETVSRGFGGSIKISFNGGSSDVPSFRSVSNMCSSLNSQSQQQSRIVPSLDSVISACVGHGPPFTSWQMCQIYNTCAESDSNMSLFDLQELLLPQMNLMN